MGAESPEWTVVPPSDPSKLTTDAVTAATEMWRRQLEAQKEILETRLDSMDRATSLRVAAIDKEPERTARQVQNLEHLQNERFVSIALQFRERDIRTDQAAIAQKQALDAALLAAKELVGQQNTANVEAAAKAETSFTKQIVQTSVLISTLEKALTDRILELKERMDRGEGSRAGGAEHRSAARSDSALGWQMVSALAALVVVAVAVYAALKP